MLPDNRQVSELNAGVFFSATNNHAERVMTLVGSCKQQGRNILDFCAQAIQTHWGHGALPSLVPA